jgi:hypothetical protein
MPGQYGALPQFHDEQEGDEDNRSCEQKRDYPRDLVAFAEPGKKRA